MATKEQLQKRREKMRARPRRPAEPSTLAYRQLLKSIADDFGAAILSELEDPVDETFREDAAFAPILKRLREKFALTAERARGNLRDIARRLLERNAADMKRSLGVEAPLVTEAMVERWIRQNVKLITNMQKEELAKVQGVITEARAAGSVVATVTKHLKERVGVVKSRAKLIATDQILTLNAQVTQERHRKLGITHFVWSSSKDARVRDEHALLDGQVFSYDDPPSEGLPGEPVRCRCVAIPVVP